MQETVDSIKEYGVLNPCIVRPREGGGYEIISGHRRKYACQLAGKAKIPAIIRNYTDDEATIIMVDSVAPVMALGVDTQAAWVIMILL